MPITNWEYELHTFKKPKLGRAKFTVVVVDITVSGRATTTGAEVWTYAISLLTASHIKHQPTALSRQDELLDQALYMCAVDALRSDRIEVDSTRQRLPSLVHLIPR